MTRQHAFEVEHNVALQAERDHPKGKRQQAMGFYVDKTPLGIIRFNRFWQTSTKAKKQSLVGRMALSSPGQRSKQCYRDTRDGRELHQRPLKLPRGFHRARTKDRCRF